MKPGRVNLTLLLLILLIGGLIYLDIQRRADEGESRDSDSLLLAMAPSEVNFLRLEFNDQIIELKKDAGQWEVILPFRDRASDALISGILESWQLLSISMLTGMDTDEDAAAIGLNPPEKKIVVGSPTARVSISVGKSLPLEEGTYVQLAAAEGIQMANGDPFEVIPEALNSFRKTTLFSGLLEDVKRFEIRGGEQSIQCVRKDSGDWMILQPFSGRGDAFSIQTYLEALYQVRVSRFVADQVSDPGIYSIDERSPEIRLYFKGDAEPVILQIGSNAKEQDEVYASDPTRSSIFTVPDHVVDLLDADVELFRDHRPVPYAADQIRGVQIRYAETDIQLEKTASNEWRIHSPEPRPASNERVQSFLDLWTSPVIREFIKKEAPPNLSSNLTPVGNLEFIEATGEEEAERSWSIQLYESDQPDLLRVHLLQDDAWGTIPSALLNDRAVQPLAFYSLQILAVEKNTIVGYALESSSVTQKVSRLESETFESESGGVVDDNQVHLLGRELASLQAVAAVAESIEVMPAEYFSDETDILTIHVRGSVGISRKLHLGKRTPSGSRYVKCLGDPVIYLVPRDTASRLVQELVLPPDPSND